MNYTFFIIKKIYKNKLNMIPFLLFMIFIIFTYGLDRTEAYSTMTDPSMSGEGSIEIMEGQIAFFESIVNDKSASINEREIAQKNLELKQTELENTKKRLHAFSNEDWKEYYESDRVIREVRLEQYQMMNDSNLNIAINAMSVYIAYDEHMLEYGDGFDHPFTNIQGIPYMMKIYKFFIALFLSIIMIFITSRVYTASNQDHMDIQNLLPISLVKRQCSKLLVGLCVGLGTVCFFSILGVLCGTMGGAMGNLHSPVYIYTIDGGGYFIPFIEIIYKLLVLMILVIAFISNAVLCISLIFRKNMTCMLLSLAVILGGLLMLPQLVQMSDYLHLLPTTYINFFNVLTGEVAYNVQNIGVNFTNGVSVLLISNAVLMVIYYIVTSIRIKR